MICLDASCLVLPGRKEPGYDAVRKLAASEHVYCAQDVEAEWPAAFHRMLREGAVRLRSYRAVLAQLQRDHAADAFRWLPVSPEVLERVREVYAGLPRAVSLRGPAARCTWRPPPSTA